MTMNAPTARSLISHAAIVAGWPMRDVIDYVNARCGDALDYPTDADTDAMRVIDNANRQRAIVLRAGMPYTPQTDDAAARALDFVRA